MAQPNQGTIIFCPCLAADKLGTRLGYGGGFYDRYLGAHPTLTRVAVCFDEFLVEDPLPRQDFDVFVDYIITDKRIIEMTR